MAQLMQNLSGRWQQSGVGRWYLGREPSERRIIAWLAAAVLLTMLWLLVWKPVADWRAVSNHRYQTAQANFSWLQANEQRARTAIPNTGDGSDRSVLRVITQAAKAQSLKLSRVQPEGEGGVSVVLQDQPFNDVLSFMAQLAENNGVRVNRAAIDGSGSVGRVNAQLKFE